MWVLGVAVLLGVYCSGGLILGIVIFLVAIPAYYSLRKIPREKQRLNFKWRIFLAAITAPVLLFIWLSYSGSYWHNQGSDEYWRAPLVYPYEVKNRYIFDNVAKVKEVYCIGTWENDGCLIENVSGYAVKEQLILGLLNDNSSWFILDGKTGEIKYFSEEIQMERAARQLGLDTMPEIKPSGEQIQAYWDK